jgi:hypothetical protein
LWFKASPSQIVLKTLSRKTHHNKRAGGVAEDVGPEFKPQYQKKKKKLISRSIEKCQLSGVGDIQKKKQI